LACESKEHGVTPVNHRANAFHRLESLRKTGGGERLATPKKFPNHAIDERRADAIIFFCRGGLLWVCRKVGKPFGVACFSSCAKPSVRPT
jgi:hypothetical protein